MNYKERASMTTSPRKPEHRLDPVVGAAPPRVWWAWLRALGGRALGRLAGVSLLLAGALALGAAALWVFGEIADEVAEGDTQALDDRVLRWLRAGATPEGDLVATFISFLGSELVAVLLVMLAGGFAWRRRWGAAATLLLVTGGAQLLNNVLKDHFQRTRPSPVIGIIAAQAWSFPSGHAMVSAAFYMALGYLSWRLLHGWRRTAMVGTLATLVVLIGLSRLYLGVHYLSDVAAGYAAGAFWAVSVITAGHLLHGRVIRRAERRDAAEDAREARQEGSAPPLTVVPAPVHRPAAARTGQRGGARAELPPRKAG